MHKWTKEIDFHKSSMVVDAFKDHFTGYVAEPMLIGHTDVLKVPAGCTSKVHSLDVCQQTLQICPKGVLGRSRR